MSTEYLVKSPIKLNLIVAMLNSTRGIGKSGTIPWRLPQDMKHFARVTSQVEDVNKMNAVIMGRRTWLSLPKIARPLPNRLNVIVSTTMSKEECGVDAAEKLNNVVVCKSFNDAIRTILDEYESRVESIFAIGGSSIYAESLTYPSGFLHRIYLTRIFADIDCDTFMEPADFLDSFHKLDNVEIVDNARFNVEFNQKLSSNGLDYIFEIYEKQ